MYFFCWPVCCLFFDLQIPITPLVSSNSSCVAWSYCKEHNWFMLWFWYTVTYTNCSKLSIALFHRAHTTSITPPLFIEVPVPIQESERSCICVLRGIDFTSFCDFDIWFGIVPTVWWFLVLILFHNCYSELFWMYMSRSQRRIKDTNELKIYKVNRIVVKLYEEEQISLRN